MRNIPSLILAKHSKPAAGCLLGQSCVSVKEYQKMYLNDEDMALSPRSLESYETNFQSYREGAAAPMAAKSEEDADAIDQITGARPAAFRLRPAVLMPRRPLWKSWIPGIKGWNPRSTSCSATMSRMEQPPSPVASAPSNDGLSSRFIVKVPIKSS